MKFLQTTERNSNKQPNKRLIFEKKSKFDTAFEGKAIKNLYLCRQTNQINRNLAYREMKPLIVTFPLSLMFFFSCGSGHLDIRVTAENAYEGVNKYCHDVYDWSAAKDNPSVMNVEMGAESDSAYEVVFRSYTGATVHFYVDKKTGNTRIVEKVPVLNIENETGTIDLLDYLVKRETRKRVNSNSSNR